MSTEVQITGIAAGGAGVGRLPDGRAVFVHRTAPGDVVRARVVRERSRWARAVLLEIQRPSPDRREAPCPHYARCGGCTLEHLRYPAQLRAKANLVREALRRIGKRTAPLPEVVASPREFRYRNRVSFTLRRLGGDGVVAGFHDIEDQSSVVDITGECLLPEQPIADVWSALRSAWGAGAERLPAGAELRLTLRAAETGSVILLVEGGWGKGRPEELMAAVPGLVGIWSGREGGDVSLLAGTAALSDRWSTDDLSISGTTFVQVNRQVARLLEAYVVTVCGAAPGLRIVDAYCGVGAYARPLARAGALVEGIERDAAAVEEARKTAPPGATFHVGRVEDELSRVLPADLLILNPPRSGLQSAVVEAILRSPPPRMVYVSCDPATLARDLARLGESYGLESLRCFDLFPQTAHVETVAELRCATS